MSEVLSVSNSQKDVLTELETLAPGAPFLALGQTVFWDEPLKAGVLLTSKALGFDRRLVAGVHDTDYFAKLPGLSPDATFRVVPHNDTTTQALWSAAAEFSRLFGSETVITRDTLTKHGVSLSRLRRVRPTQLDDATEAWGWRAVVSTSEEAPVVSELLMSKVAPSLLSAFDWARSETKLALGSCPQQKSKSLGDSLTDFVHKIADQSKDATLSEYYQALLPEMYAWAASEKVEIDATATTKLLRFNGITHDLPRFDILNLFLHPLTRAQAVNAYNNAVRGSEIYTLDRFGSWAIPFDVVIPGQGRGTIRVAPKAVIIMTPNPLFITTKEPVTSARDLALALERKFGPDCVVIGKAVTFVAMLSREFVFTFHAGASAYVRFTRRFLAEAYPDRPTLPFFPILRVKIDAWSALAACQEWIKLPHPLQGPFGTEELCASSFAARWKLVAQDRSVLLEELATLRRPIDFISWLGQKGFGAWRPLGEEYEGLHLQLDALHNEIAAIKKRKDAELLKLRTLKQQLAGLEKAKGVHWREFFFEKTPAPEDFHARESFSKKILETQALARESKSRWIEIQADQDALVKSPRVMALHERRRAIELEAELKRVKLVREAVIATKGMAYASSRPSAWWFPLVSPDGTWFREVTKSAEYSLEVLR